MSALKPDMSAGRPIPKLSPEERLARETNMRDTLRQREKEREQEAVEAVSKAIDKLRQDAADKLAEADRIEQARKLFPDLRRHVGRWDKVAYYSKAANPNVTKFDLRHNCGCCEDAPLELWPYLESSAGRIYSDPPCFVVGEKDYRLGDRPNSGWQDKLRGSSLPQVIIDGMEAHFQKCRQDALDDIDSAYEGESEDPELEDLSL